MKNQNTILKLIRFLKEYIQNSKKYLWFGDNVESRATNVSSTIFLAYGWIDSFVQRLPFVVLLSGSAKFRHNGCQSSWWSWTGGTIVNYTHIFTVVM